MTLSLDRWTTDTKCSKCGGSTKREIQKAGDRVHVYRVCAVCKYRIKI